MISLVCYSLRHLSCIPGVFNYIPVNSEPLQRWTTIHQAVTGSSRVCLVPSLHLRRLLLRVVSSSYTALF